MRPPVLALPVGDERGASTRYRVLAHRRMLAAEGLGTEVLFPLKAAASRSRFKRVRDLLRDVRAARRARLLFVQRKTYPAPFDRLLAGAGAPLVFDVDDAIYLPPPGRDLPVGAARRYREQFRAMVERADLVICGNDVLAAEVPHERVAVLPTAVDTDRFRPAPRENGPPRLGWVGHSDNLPYLERLAEPLRELSRRHPGLELVVVADREPRLPGVQVRFRPWSLAGEVKVFEGIDAGLMPLDDTPWTRAKCAFKAIQYMALGIPAVASPVGMNREVIRSGENGYLPETDEEWVACIDGLLGDPSRAAALGAAARETVEARYSLRAVTPRLARLLRELLEQTRR